MCQATTSMYKEWQRYQSSSLCNVLQDSMYYIVTPGEIVVAQPCTKVDHVTWLLTHQKYEGLVEFFEGTTLPSSLTRRWERRSSGLRSDETFG